MTHGVRALSRVAAAINSSLKLEEILRSACAAAVDLLGVGHSATVLFSPDLKFGRVLAESPALGAVGIRIPLLGVPIEEQLIATRRPVVIDSVPDDDRLGAVRDILQTLRIQSTLLVPITTGDRILGSFSLDSVEVPRVFRDDEIDLCEAVAAQVAVAIDNARLFEETQLRAEQLESLRRATLEYTSLFEFERQGRRDELLSKIIQKAVELLGARGGGIYEYDPPTGVLTVIADHNRPEHRGRQLTVGQGMAGRLVQMNRPYVIVKDYRHWPDRSDVFGNSSFESVIEVPLTWRNQTTGVLYIDDNVPREFTPDDAVLLRMYADQASIALATAHFVSETSQRQTDVASQPTGEHELSRATRAILTGLGTTPLDQRLTLIARHATTILRAEVCQVFLVKRPGVISVEASYGQPDGTFQKNREFQIRTGPKTGLTGHIAFEAKTFRAHGEALTGHPAARGLPPDHLASGQCCSLLGIPLFKSGDKSESADTTEPLIGFLLVDNKLGANGEPSPHLGFSEDDVRDAEVFAEAVVTAIEGEAFLARWQAEMEVTARRNELLGDLVSITHHLHADKEPRDLERDVVRAAVSLTGYSTAYLVEHEANSGRLRVVTGHSNEPPLAAMWEGPALALAGQVVRSRAAATTVVNANASGDDPESDHHCTLVGVPIRQQEAISHLLVVATDGVQRRLLETEVEVLQHFATRVAALFQESHARYWERRLIERASVLRRISEYMLRASDLDQVLAALLTGVTAGYGFGLNRAAVLLYDTRREYLEGRMGVGHHTDEAARASWDHHHKDSRESFGRFIQLYESEGHASNPIDEAIRNVRLIAAHPDVTRFVASLRNGPRVVSPEDAVHELPESLLGVFGSRSPFVVAPLLWHDTVVGVVIGDNAFTSAVVAEGDLESLGRLSTTAALAVDLLAMPRTLSQEQLAKLEEIQDAFERAEGKADLDAIEQQLVQSALGAFHGHAAMLWSYDAMTDQFLLKACAGRVPDHVRDLLAQNPPQQGQTTYTVQERNWMGVEDLNSAQELPFLTERTRAALAQFYVRSFQGVALKLGDEKLGVLYINYDRRRTFHDDDRDALLSFAAQAALTLKKARMLDQVRRARDTARAVARLTKLADLESTLVSVVRETQTALRADAVTLYEYNAESGRFGYPPTMSGVWNEAAAMALPGVPADSIVRQVLDMDKLWVVENAAKDAMFSDTRFRVAERIMSCVPIPLRVGSAKAGVMFVNYRNLHRFTFDELTNLNLFADQAALAIHSAQLYQRVDQQARAIQASYQASQAIMGSLDMERILARVAEQAWHLTSITGAEPTSASVTLFGDESPDERASYPHTNSQQGKSGREAVSDKDGAEIREHTVPIDFDNHVLGEISVGHASDRPPLGVEEERTLGALALHAAAAIKNVQRHQELLLAQEQRNKAREREEVALDLAALGIVSKEWGHVVHKSGIIIGERVNHMHDDLDQLEQIVGQNPDAAEHFRQLSQRLMSIAKLVPRIQSPPVMESPHDNVHSIRVNELLRDFLEANRIVLEVANVGIDFNLALDDGASVQANPRWLARVLEHLTSNAITAMDGLPSKRLTVTAGLRDRTVQIDFTDSGKGISADIRDRILKLRIEKLQGEHGLGMGLLLANTIARIYGGEILVVDHAPGVPGTTIRILLPLVPIAGLRAEPAAAVAL